MAVDIGAVQKHLQAKLFAEQLQMAENGFGRLKVPFGGWSRPLEEMARLCNETRWPTACCPRVSPELSENMVRKVIFACKRCRKV